MIDDFLKDPKKATLYYREEGLRAMAAGQKSAARYWRLTADAAKQVVRQNYGNSILVPIRMPFVDHFTQLALALQKADAVLESPCWKKNEHDEFEKEIVQKIFPHDRYWRRCLVVSCSHHFEREMQQIVEAEKKYVSIFPNVAASLAQALHGFKMARQHQQDGVTSSLIQKELQVNRWVSVAHEAAHVANISVQHAVVAKEKNNLLLENWAAMTRDAEQALSLRIKAAKAGEKGDEESAIEYSLAAFVMNDAVESRVQVMKVIMLNNELLASQLQEMLHLPSGIVEKRTAIATSQTANSFFDNAVSWLEAAWEADLKRMEAIVQGYHLVTAYWQESRDCSKQVADLCNKAASTMNFSYRFASWWRKRKLFHLEKKAQKKIPVMLMEEIFFCMPKNYFPSFELRAKWERGEFVSFLDINRSLTVNAWLYQTGSLLQKVGVRSHFFTKMPHLPHRGIIVTMSGFLYGYEKKITLPPSLFVADIVAEEGIPHSAAMLHLIPNSHSTKYLPFTEFIPHWPQPFLIPRDAVRRERFETICFMGDSKNMATELCSQEWHLRLQQELGLHFIRRDFDRWHDFSDVDCIVAIRDFTGNYFFYKPAHKLYNAWLAGVPFIGGRDSAFVGDGHPGEDYLVANSAEEVFEYLKKLKEDPLFRSQLVERGRQSGAAFSREAVLQSWKRLVQETLPVQALKWHRASALKRFFLRVLQRWSCRIQSFVYKHYKPKKHTFILDEKKDLFAWASQPTGFVE